MKALIIQGQGMKCEADKVLIRATINVWLIVMLCTASINIRQQIFLFFPQHFVTYYQYLKYQQLGSKTKFELQVNIYRYSSYINCESYVNYVWTVVK